MIRSWKENNTLREAENLKARGRILDQEPYKGKFSQMSTSNIMEPLKSNLEKVTTQLEKLEAERKETFGKIEGTSEYNNKKHPRYPLHKIYMELVGIIEGFKNDPDHVDIYNETMLGWEGPYNLDYNKYMYSLLGRCHRDESKRGKNYNTGYKDSSLYTFTTDWIETVEIILDAAGYSEEEKEAFIQRGLDAQEKACKETPILAEYNEEIYALQQIKKNLEESINLLQRI